jgi:hypothetical protein
MIRTTIPSKDWHLSGPSDFPSTVLACSMRYLLDDYLTQLCTVLAYSKGSSTSDCVDLVRVPNQIQWVEWCDSSRRDALQMLGFPQDDHIEVRAAIATPLYRRNDDPAISTRRGPRLHHVRGHLVRRGSQVHWRVPHLRGHTRHGVIKHRTVTWTIDERRLQVTEPSSGASSHA